MTALLVFLAVVAVYMQSLGGPFLWDDRLLIVHAPLIEQGGSLGDFLNAPFWAGGAGQGSSASYYRPLVTLSFAFDKAVHGDNSGGFHLTNVALHALNAVLVHALLRKHGARAATAGLLAVGWALLPRLAEAAAWISGRTDLLATSFTLAALLVWGPNVARRMLAALFVGAGLLAKESALAGALALAAGAWVAAAEEPGRRRTARVITELAPLVVALMLYSALRIAAVGFENDARDLGALGRARTVLEALGTYAAMLVDAWRPRALVGRLGQPSLDALAAGIAVVALLAALLRFRSRLGPASATGAALFFGSLLFVVHVVPIPLRTLAADRFLYLPTAGLALWLAPSLDRLLGVRRERWAMALALVASLGFVAFRRVGVWSDEIAFWVETYLETPTTNNAAAAELASVYYRAGLFEDALILSERALRYDDPNRESVIYNTGLCLLRLGRLDAARARFSKLASKRRWAEDVGIMLAVIEIRAGRFENARATLAPLVPSGGATVRQFSRKLGELETAQRTLDALDASSPPERRAELATLLDDDAIAAPAWLEVLRAPNAREPSANKALQFLVQRGDRQALITAASVYETRFGSPDGALSRMIAVQLEELDRLVAARALIRLSGPERTKEIAPPAR